MLNFVSQDDFMGNKSRYSLQSFPLCLFVDFLDPFLERPPGSRTLHTFYTFSCTEVFVSIASLAIADFSSQHIDL